jgi:hypothetical protein
MVKSSENITNFEYFPDIQIVVPVARQLSWQPVEKLEQFNNI